MNRRLRTYEGSDITVRYDSKRCIHAAECVRGLGQVFDPGARPWVNPDAAPAEEVAAVIRRCPTGALSYESVCAEDGASTPEPPQFSVVADGPIYVHGEVSLQAGKESVLHESRVALCRCGASTNKPFCDNSHAEVKFEDSGEIQQEGSDSISAGEVLTVTPVPNGPVLLKGPFSIVSADGARVFHGEKGALCRCGASANKPFCDGAHKSIGFETD